MEWAIGIACLALTALTLLYVLHVERDAADEAAHRSELDRLLERRDTIYENLRDLRFEHRAGKYSDADYDEMRRALEQEAAQVLAEIERATGSSPRPPRRESGAATGPSAGQ
jgi:hypothetical protein